MPTLTAFSLQKKPTDARQEIRDHGALGLYLVIQPKPTGAKSWALRFQNASGKSAKLVLGSLDFTDDAKLQRRCRHRSRASR